MKTAHGFTLEKEAGIAEFKTQAQVWRHQKTGGRLLSLINDDENKVFALSFRTPPKDSTGVAHILEHSVLCGSRKYPVKEPFVELLKGSLQTFLNAFTYPDKTCYPVASANLQDFYNLVDVYLDAVFYPNLNDQVLMQEGWHYAITDPAEPLTYKGVVFNEMKGAYSSPDSLLHQYSQQSLFPDTTYGLDSGGHPEHIPGLTLDAFLNFHKTFYHPSNGYAFFYGDDDPDKRLQMLDAYYSAFEKIEPHSEIAQQKPFTAAKRIEKKYAASDATAKAMFTLNFGFDKTLDPYRTLCLHVLEHILIGLPSSPLRKALIDSGLGEDLAGVGLEDELGQMYFATGLKGIDPGNIDAAEKAIFDCLRRLADQGIENDDIEAAINSMEFYLRENNSGSYPRGLLLMLKALTTWLYGGDPLALLPFEQPLQQLKDQLAQKQPVFEDLITQNFLDNPYRTRLTLVPDTELERSREERERQHLTKVKAGLSQEQLEQMTQAVGELQKHQQTADSAEALATIPRLSLADLPTANTPIPLDVVQTKGRDVLFHDLQTNGIVYLDVGFDLGLLPDNLLPYASIFGRALLEMGTKQYDFVALTQRIAQKTGGIDPRLLILPVRDSQDSCTRFMLQGKATLDRTPELVQIMQDVLLNTNFDNPERLLQIALESKARHEQHLIPAGHRVADARLRARFSRAGHESEMVHGISALMFLRQLCQRIEKDFPSVLADLNQLRGLLLTGNAAFANCTTDATAFAKVQPEIDGLFSCLPQAQQNPAERGTTTYPEREGLTIPAQVNYVAKGANVYQAGYKYSGAIHVVSRFLSTAYLWDRVRVQGGAYGAFCNFSRLTGALGYVSYRDPNLSETLTAFDEVAGFIRDNPVPKEELEKAIIGAIGEVDTYRLPDAKGFVSMTRYLTGEDETYLQKVRAQIMATSQQDFADFAEAADAVQQQGEVVVVGAAETLSAVQPAMTVTKVL